MELALWILSVMVLGLCSYVHVKWAASDATAKAETDRRQAALDELERQVERTREADAQVARLLKQIQDLSQQLATIRLENPGAVPDEKVYEVQEPPRPYSEELQMFVSGIENEEARVMVEEQVDMGRARGWSDARILKHIDEGEY